MTADEWEARFLDFDGLRIGYDARVLEPREWTAAQSRWARRLAREVPEGPVLELCCGAGHIGLLAVRDSGRDLVMVDADPTAAAWATANAESAGMAARVEVRLARMEDALAVDELFPLVLADPPWVPTGGVARWPQDPVLAIDGGADGLDLVRTSLGVVGRHLLPGGAALLQVGPGQVEDVRALVDGQPSLGLLVRSHLVVEDRGAIMELRRR